MKRKFNLQVTAIFLVAIFALHIAFAQEDTLHVRSEGGGSTQEEAINNALIKVVSAQVDALARLKAGKRDCIKNKVLARIDPFIVAHEVVQASDKTGVQRAILDVELNIFALVEKLVKLDLAENFRYKPRLMIVIVEKEDGQESGN